MAEGARLESVFTRKGNVGSNPTLSAITLVGQHLRHGDTYTDTKSEVTHVASQGQHSRPSMLVSGALTRFWSGRPSALAGP